MTNFKSLRHIVEKTNHTERVRLIEIEFDRFKRLCDLGVLGSDQMNEQKLTLETILEFLPIRGINTVCFSIP